jgi:hypothetical protein
MKALIDAMAGLPKLVKLILCIPALDIVWTIYRLCRSLEKKNVVGIVLAIVLLIVGIPWVWLIDLICVILKGEVWWID